MKSTRSSYGTIESSYTRDGYKEVRSESEDEYEQSLQDDNCKLHKWD